MGHLCCIFGGKYCSLVELNSMQNVQKGHVFWNFPLRVFCGPASALLLPLSCRFHTVSSGKNLWPRAQNRLFSKDVNPRNHFHAECPVRDKPIHTMKPDAPLERINRNYVYLCRKTIRIGYQLQKKNRPKYVVYFNFFLKEKLTHTDTPTTRKKQKRLHH